MKTLFRVLALGLFLTASSVLTFAQESEFATLFEKFKAEAKAKCGERAPAMATGKTLLEKYGPESVEGKDNPQVLEFVKKRMGVIEKEDPRCKLNDRYNKAYNAKDWPNFFAASKEVMTAEGDSPLGLDLLLTHVSVGYNRSAEDKIETYNAETVSYAKQALQKLQSGKTSQTGKYGVWEPFGSKDNAQTWMNYIIGWISYEKLNQKDKDSLSYLYKATQVGTEKKNDAQIYIRIGTYFANEAGRLFTEYQAEREANNKEDNDSTRAKLGLARGTADRALDAFGRANNLVKNDAQIPAATKKGIADKLVELYKFRHNTADAKQPDVDKYVSDMVAKQMPDPSTAVTPVVIEVKPATTTTTSTTSSTTPATTTPATTTSSTTTKTAPATKEASTATTTNKATTVKKPAPKKKGTR